MDFGNFLRHCSRLTCLFLSFWHLPKSVLLSLQFLANGFKPNSSFAQNLRREALLFAKHRQQEVFRPNVTIRQPLRFPSAVGQNTFALVADGKIARPESFTCGLSFLDSFPDA